MVGLGLGLGLGEQDGLEIQIISNYCETIHLY